MSNVPEELNPNDSLSCVNGCAAVTSIEALNQSCHCLSFDLRLLHKGLGEELQSRSLSDDMITTHPHLFSSVPLFVSRSHLDRMAQVISAIHAVVASAHFQAMVLAWAPDIARFDPKSPGGMLGYDFHLSVEGPKLIEINTNPGGLLLNAVLGKAQQSCCRDAAGLALSASVPSAIEDIIMDVFLAEWRLQRGDEPLRSIAILDETPEQQYLYPEFRLYQQLFRRYGLQAMICAPDKLHRHDGRVWHEMHSIDFLYNRLTDFALERAEHAALKAAYLAGEALVSPHPHAHALYADKRNLTLLCNEAFLREARINEETIRLLICAIPQTQIVTAENRDLLWQKRRGLFFKPAGGFGSKATYRGDKITQRVWEQMKSAVYVAQALVPPSERQVSKSQFSTSLKADVRNYAYGGTVKLVAARLYQGQTTNFRTPGGGFAPVFTQAQREPAA